MRRQINYGTDTKRIQLRVCVQRLHKARLEYLILESNEKNPPALDKITIVRDPLNTYENPVAVMAYQKELHANSYSHA